MVQPQRQRQPTRQPQSQRSRNQRQRRQKRKSTATAAAAAPRLRPATTTTKSSASVCSVSASSARRHDAAAVTIASDPRPRPPARRCDSSSSDVLSKAVDNEPASGDVPPPARTRPTPLPVKVVRPSPSTLLSRQKRLDNSHSACKHDHGIFPSHINQTPEEQQQGEEETPIGDLKLGDLRSYINFSLSDSPDLPRVTPHVTPQLPRLTRVPTDDDEAVPVPRKTTGAAGAGGRPFTAREDHTYQILARTLLAANQGGAPANTTTSGDQRRPPTIVSPSPLPLFSPVARHMNALHSASSPEPGQDPFTHTRSISPLSCSTIASSTPRPVSHSQSHSHTGGHHHHSDRESRSSLSPSHSPALEGSDTFHQRTTDPHLAHMSAAQRQNSMSPRPFDPQQVRHHRHNAVNGPTCNASPHNHHQSFFASSPTSTTSSESPRHMQSHGHAHPHSVLPPPGVHPQIPSLIRPPAHPAPPPSLSAHLPPLDHDMVRPPPPPDAIALDMSSLPHAHTAAPKPAGTGRRKGGGNNKKRPSKSAKKSKDAAKNACQVCYIAKTRCTRNDPTRPCDRCARLKKTCVERELNAERTDRACQWCHFKKAACGNERPCKLCVKHGRECVEREPSKKSKGRPPKVVAGSGSGSGSSSSTSGSRSSQRKKGGGSNGTAASQAHRASQQRRQQPPPAPTKAASAPVAAPPPPGSSGGGNNSGAMVPCTNDSQPMPKYELIAALARRIANGTAQLPAELMGGNLPQAFLSGKLQEVVSKLAQKASANDAGRSETIRLRKQNLEADVRAHQGQFLFPHHMPPHVLPPMPLNADLMAALPHPLSAMAIPPMMPASSSPPVTRSRSTSTVSSASSSSSGSIYRGPHLQHRGSLPGVASSGPGNSSLEMFLHLPSPQPGFSALSWKTAFPADFLQPGYRLKHDTSENVEHDCWGVLCTSETGFNSMLKFQRNGNKLEDASSPSDMRIDLAGGGGAVKRRQPPPRGSSGGRRKRGGGGIFEELIGVLEEDADSLRKCDEENLELFLAWLTKSIDMDSAATTNGCDSGTKHKAAAARQQKSKFNMKVEKGRRTRSGASASSSAASSQHLASMRDSIRKLAEERIVPASSGKPFSMPEVAVDTEPCGDLMTIGLRHDGREPSRDAMYHEIRFVEPLASVRQSSANADTEEREESVGAAAALSPSKRRKLNSASAAAADHRGSGSGSGSGGVVVKHRCSASLKNFLGEDGIAMDTVTRHIFSVFPKEEWASQMRILLTLIKGEQNVMESPLIIKCRLQSPNNPRGQPCFQSLCLTTNRSKIESIVYSWVPTTEAHPQPLPQPSFAPLPMGNQLPFMSPPPLSSPLAGLTLSGSGPCSSPALNVSRSHGTSASCELPEISAPSSPANHDPFLSSVNGLMPPSISLDGHAKLKSESGVHSLSVSTHHHADLPPLGASPEPLSMHMDSFAPPDVDLTGNHSQSQLSNGLSMSSIQPPDDASHSHAQEMFKLQAQKERIHSQSMAVAQRNAELNNAATIGSGALADLSSGPRLQSGTLPGLMFDTYGSLMGGSSSAGPTSMASSSSFLMPVVGGGSGSSLSLSPGMPRVGNLKSSPHLSTGMGFLSSPVTPLKSSRASSSHMSTGMGFLNSPVMPTKTIMSP